MTGEHIPDLELSLYAFDPDALSRERAAEIDRHTARCADCGVRLDFYAVAEEDLHDPSVWVLPAVSPASAMRAYARRCQAEDAEADALLEPYFRNPVKAAWHLGRRRELYTGGVVRKLNAQAHATFASLPRVALTHADNAQVIAEALPDDLYPNGAVYELRGTAWKERANALVRLGRLDEALESVRRAERAYEHLQSSGHGLAAVELVRAAAYYQMGELTKAEYHADRAAQGYTKLGQRHRTMKALLLRGEIQYEAAQFDDAAKIFARIIDYGEELADPQWIAKGSYTLASCELERGKLGEATVLYTKALVIFRETGPTADRVSTEWGLARVVLGGGNASEAVRRLHQVVTAFEEIGMVTDAALASLDMADALFVLQRMEQIEKLAAHAFRVLKEAGILSGALTALAYLKEAAATRRLNRKVIHGIRKFLQQAERDPELLFVPPPDTFN
jgi:tetratricopeptide (TPR) repeat protein